MVSTGIKSYVAVHIHNSKLIIKHVQLCNQFMSICYSGHTTMPSCDQPWTLNCQIREKTCTFFPNGCFGNGKDRGWWGVSAIGLCVGLDLEAELLQAAARNAPYRYQLHVVYERERLVSITTHNVLQVCISIMSCDCFGIANSSERIQSIHVYYK